VTREQLGVDAAPLQLDVPSPGTRYRHYAPACVVEIVAPAALEARAQALAREGLRAGAVAPAHCRIGDAVPIATFTDVDELARGLYSAFRAAEAADIDVLLCSAVPENGVGRAIMDRLRRAAAARN
jgi:L-threonylcarbamoyladenylate synthase